MWNANGNNLQMCEGDWGIKLPVSVDGTTFSANDVLRFTFKDQKNGTLLLTKEYTDIQENTVNLEFTEEDTSVFAVGIYAYALDWYQNGAFMCNIIPAALLKVVDKA